MNDKERFDVGCGMVAFKVDALKKMEFDKAPSGYNIDAWMKKQSIKKGLKIGFMPVDVSYDEDRVRLSPKNLLKYAKMFFVVCIEILRP